jgi:hypothetical protein
MRTPILCTLALACAVPALAQNAPAPIEPARVTFAAPTAQAPAPAERQGFTLLLNMGFGVQHDGGMQESATGLSGLNLGIGGFLNKNLAVMFRLSGTNVTYDSFFYGRFDQISGVGGVTLQFWPSDRFNIEGGAGFGLWTTEFESEAGFGFIVAGNAVVFHKGKHYLLVGAEYAPAFTDWGTIQNFGITFGYQFHR